MSYSEINFDGLVGPSHNYAGLAKGNIASSQNALQVSYPREAALQGLSKMKFLSDLGVPQAILPPHPRPNTAELRKLGFSGNDKQILNKVAKEEPHILAGIYSASSMWTANSATISPSCNTRDGRLHITPANLISHFHRSLEARFNYKIFKQIFADKRFFQVHRPLTASEEFSDEGAANHMSLWSSDKENSLELFIYGRSKGSLPLKNFNPRQCLEASKAINRLHKIKTEQSIFIQQSPQAIDAGVFHNDVISTSNQNFLIAHEKAFLNHQSAIQQIKEIFSQIHNTQPIIRLISEHELPIKEAIASYFFNTQIISLNDRSMCLIAPIECQENLHAQRLIKTLLNDDLCPIQSVHFFDLRQSMKNGGGPACLRLRVRANETEREAMHQGVFLTPSLYKNLVEWVKKHYREELSPKDLADPLLANEIATSLNELAKLIKMPKLYS
jgi:succinylarginine dihydrolase